MLVLFFAVFSTENLHAQNRYTENGIDSAAIQKRINQEYARRDSMLNAVRIKRSQDSLARELQKIKLQEFRDSMILARAKKRIDDSVARVNAKIKLQEEKRIKDSTDVAIRKHLEDSVANVRLAEEKRQNEIRRINDSIAAAQQRVMDSTRLARERISDSLKEVRQKAAAARLALEKYKNSKHYKDSVELAKKNYKDSLSNARLAKQELQKNQRARFTDSIRSVRQRINDSLLAERERIKDSTVTARTQQLQQQKDERQRINDSLLASRKARMDSLDAKRKIVKKENEAEVEKKKKDLSLKINMAENIHEKKKEEWTNDKLLKRKWSIHRRIYQNTVTRYNYYYNAKRKYDDGIRSMKKSHKDDFAGTISLLPYDVTKQGSSVASDMDTVIKKSSLSTQIHDPRSKWFDNLYFLMGRASFVKNDFDGAIETFQFVANEYKNEGKKKTKSSNPSSKSEETALTIATPDKRKGLRKFKHHPVRNEALIWLAKSYIMAEQYNEANSLLSILESDKNFPARNKADLFLTKAYLNLEQKNIADAIPDLEQALKQNLKGLQRSRTEYVLAQCYATEKNYAKSTTHFNEALYKKNSPEMDFFIRLNIAQNAANGGGDKKQAIAQLDKIINDPKFETYKSQALVALANIEAESAPEKAISHLQKAIKNPENKDIKQKALAFAGLGKIYYNQSQYVLAKTAYDSAFTYGSTPPIDNIQEITTRKNVLTEIVKYTGIIATQDSMLALSEKSEKEQRAAAKRELEKAKLAAKNNSEVPVQVVALQPSSKSKSNWYFYNNALIQKGSSDFKQKWGERKLQDNWRRASAMQSGFANNNSEGDEETKNGDEDNSNSSNIANLLAALPKTPSAKDAAHQKIMEAYYNLGLTYFSQLQDYSKSIETFNSLLTKYPSTTYKQQTYYGLFVDYQKLNNEIESNRYKKLLNDEFKLSEFAQLANNPNYKETKSESLKSLFVHYDSTYTQYKTGRFKEALESVTYAQANFTSNPIKAKYELVEAISNAGLNEMVKCKQGLEKIISNYPNTEEQIRAQEILAYFKKEITGDSSSLKTSGGNDSVKSAESAKTAARNDGKGIYIYEPTSEHLVMVYVKALNGNAMSIKSGLSDYNLLKYNVEEYSTGLNLLTEQEGLFTVQTFQNNVSAKKYLGSLVNEKMMFNSINKKDIEFTIISKRNFTELLGSRDIAGYLQFYRKNYP